MKAFFFSINNIATPHFETELELMSNHLNKGDGVYVLRCLGNLKRCYSNPENFKSVCFSCKLRFDIGIKRVGVLPENVFALKENVDYKDIPPIFKTLKELKNFCAYGARLGFGVFSYLVSELRSHKFDTSLYKDRIFKTLGSSILIYETVHELLQKLQPKVVYVFNGRFFDVWSAIQACEKLGIDYYTHERVAELSRYALFKNCLPHDLQNVKSDIERHWSNSSVSESEKRKIGQQFFFNKRNRINQGLYVSFIRYQKRGLLPKGFDKTKTNIVMFNSSIDEYASFEEHKNPIYANDYDSLKSIMESFKNREDIRFYLKLHPNLKDMNNAQIKEIKNLDDLKYKNLRIIWPEEKIDSYALLDNCEKVISFISTMVVEACFWGKPSILIGRAFYEDLDCCYRPRSREEVIKLIDSKLEPKNNNGAIKYGFWCLTRGIFYKKFKSTGKFTGIFLGKSLWDDFTLKDRLKLKYLILKDLGFKRSFIWQLTKLKRYVASKRENWFRSR